MCIIRLTMPGTMDKRNSRCFLAAALLIAVVLMRGSVQAGAPPFPVLAVDPLPEVAELENHSACLPRWLSRSFTKTVLLHIDVKNGIRPLGAAQSAVLAEISQPRAAGSPAPAALDAAAKRSLFETSFIRAAVSLKIVREAYWIFPFDYFRRPDPAGSLRAELKEVGFNEEDLRTFALRDGCFRGFVAGTSFAVCSMEALPQIAEPVLLSVNADFVLSAAAVASTNPIVEISKLLAALAAKKYAVLDATVTNAPTPRRDQLWVGEAVAQALRDPALLARSGTPKRWSVLQTLTRLQDIGDFNEMVHQIVPSLTIHEDDPALQFFYAEALSGLGRQDGALGRAELACRLSMGYCYGLPWIGLQLSMAGDIESGERFFAAGEKLRPDMEFGQFNRGLALFRADRRAEALKVFLKLSNGGAAFPSGFLAGKLHVLKGDRQSARRQFDLALEALLADPEATVIDPDTAQAIWEAAQLYREEGLIRQAELLENDQRLKFTLEADPPTTPQP